MEKEKKKKRSVADSGTAEEAPVKPRTPERPRASRSSNKSNRRTWSPSDFSAEGQEDLHALINAEGAIGTFYSYIFTLECLILPFSILSAIYWLSSSHKSLTYLDHVFFRLLPSF